MEPAHKGRRLWLIVKAVHDEGHNEVHEVFAREQAAVVDGPGCNVVQDIGVQAKTAESVTKSGHNKGMVRHQAEPPADWSMSHLS